MTFWSHQHFDRDPYPDTPHQSQLPKIGFNFNALKINITIDDREVFSKEISFYSPYSNLDRTHADFLPLEEAKDSEDLRGSLFLLQEFVLL